MLEFFLRIWPHLVVHCKEFCLGQLTKIGNNGDFTQLCENKSFKDLQSFARTTTTPTFVILNPDIYTQIGVDFESNLFKFKSIFGFNELNLNQSFNLIVQFELSSFLSDDIIHIFDNIVYFIGKPLTTLCTNL